MILKDVILPVDFHRHIVISVEDIAHVNYYLINSNDAVISIIDLFLVTAINDGL
jgi:hypothetical protein